MQPDRAERVAEIVERALEVEIGQRGPLIVDSCGGDQDLFVEVASLLQFQEKARDFIEKPAVEKVAEILVEGPGELKPGDTLDHYQIVSLIGEGGMGEVYLAKDNSLGRKVAIKLLRFGLGTTNIIRRFHEEERILAGLTHPNIAQLYGGAVTPGGLPYFVMEYVDGSRLDDYCCDHQLPVRERLKLFRKVCAAVAYAHQRLVIHRDLKPANVRVTSDGEPKLLDFGIAKLLDPATATLPELTITSASVMTPLYASPEQIRGEQMTTTSDVYSLGVLLYELLTGQKPYKIENRSATNIMRAIAEQEVARPSTVVAKSISNSPESGRATWQNSKLLRGDLDNIVLKALRKEPERRYASVGQFSGDLGSYLEGRPVIARKDTFNYRAMKFITRNKIGVAAAVLVFLTLVGGIVATAWEARRANRRFNQVRRLANSLMFEIHDSVKDLQGSTPTRRLIVSRALEYLDSLADDAGNNASLQRELATAYEKVGDIQGNPYYANLGDTNGALASYRKAMTIRENLRDKQSTLDSQMEMGRTYRALGDILEQKGEIAETVRNYRQSLSIFEQLAVKYPAEFSAKDELARAHETLGDGLGRAANSTAERRKCYETALSIRQNLLAAQPSSPQLRRSVALNLLKIGSVFEANDPHTMDQLRHSVVMLEKLAAEDPNNERAHREVGFVYYQLGQVQIAGGDYAGALKSRRKAFDIREQIAANDPKNAQARFDLAVAHGDLSEALNLTGEYKDALNRAHKSLSILQELSTSDPTNAVYLRNVGMCYEKLAEASARSARDQKNSFAEKTSDWTETRNWYRKGEEVFSTLRQRGALMPTDSQEVDRFAAKVRECDAAIAELKK